MERDIKPRTNFTISLIHSLFHIIYDELKSPRRRYRCRDMHTLCTDVSHARTILSLRFWLGAIPRFRRYLAVRGASTAISFGELMPLSFCHAVENQFASISGLGHPHSPTESSSSSGDWRKVNELKVVAAPYGDTYKFICIQKWK